MTRLFTLPFRTVIKWAVMFFLLITVIYEKNSYAQFTFIHITDVHVSDGSSGVNESDIGGVTAQCYLNEFNNLDPKPAFVVVSGDIGNVGNASAGMYTAFTQHCFPSPLTNPNPGDYFIDSAQTIPIYFTPGNHDYYYTLVPPLSSGMTNYPSNLSPDIDYVVTLDSAVIVMMRSGEDAIRPITEDPNITTWEGSGLTDVQCTWLRNELSIAGNKKKIIAMHHPTVNIAGTTWDGQPYSGIISDAADGSIINNRTTFLNICDSNNVDIVLTGHKHFNVVASRDENVVPEDWTGGTRYIITASARDRAYRIISVSQNFVSVSPGLISCDSSSAGFAEMTKLENLFVYPNPNFGKFQVSSRNNIERIEVYNVFGERIYSENYKSQTPVNIDISGYSEGIYFVNIFDGRRIYSKKISVL